MGKITKKKVAKKPSPTRLAKEASLIETVIQALVEQQKTIKECAAAITHCASILERNLKRGILK